MTDAPVAVAAEVPRPAEPRQIVLGASVNGSPIHLYLFGAPAPQPSDVTLVIAAIHGNETPAVRFGQRLVQHLRDHPDAAGGRAVAVIPVANPDGVAGRSRTNGNGVDCNRNFPASNWKKTPRGWSHAGSSPASEPETRAIMAAIETLRPARVVSVHSPLRCNNYDGPEPAATLAALMSRHNGYPVTPTIGYATPGSFGSWAGIDLGIPVVTLELPGRIAGEQAWQENLDAILAVVRYPAPSQIPAVGGLQP